VPCCRLAFPSLRRFLPGGSQGSKRPERPRAAGDRFVQFEAEQGRMPNAGSAQRGRGSRSGAGQRAFLLWGHLPPSDARKEGADAVRPGSAACCFFQLQEVRAAGAPVILLL